MCLLYVSLVLRVSPNMFVLMFMGNANCVLYSAGSGVKRVHVWIENEIVCLCMYFM